LSTRGRFPVGRALCGLPPQVRRGTADHDKQRDQGMGAGPRFLDAQQLVKDVTAITELHVAKPFQFMMVWSPKTYNAFQGPTDLTLTIFSRTVFRQDLVLNKDSREIRQGPLRDRKLDDAMKRRRSWKFSYRTACGCRSVHYDFARTESASSRTPRSKGKFPLRRYNNPWRRLRKSSEHAQERDSSPSGTRITASMKSTPRARRSISQHLRRTP